MTHKGRYRAAGAAKKSNLHCEPEMCKYIHVLPIYVNQASSPKPPLLFETTGRNFSYAPKVNGMLSQNLGIDDHIKRLVISLARLAQAMTS